VTPPSSPSAPTPHGCAPGRGRDQPGHRRAGLPAPARTTDAAARATGDPAHHHDGVVAGLPRPRALVADRLTGTTGPSLDAADVRRRPVAEIADWALRQDLWCVTDDFHVSPFVALLSPAAPGAGELRTTRT
jgi:hypothetical protein